MVVLDFSLLLQSDFPSLRHLLAINTPPRFLESLSCLIARNNTRLSSLRVRSGDQLHLWTSGRDMAAPATTLARSQKGTCSLSRARARPRAPNAMVNERKQVRADTLTVMRVVQVQVRERPHICEGEREGDCTNVWRRHEKVSSVRAGKRKFVRSACKRLQ